MTADPPRPSKWVLLYQPSDLVAELAPVQFPAHSEHLERFRARDELLLVGTFADAHADGSMSVFRSREGAEQFVADDPFVVSGVISDYRLLEWHEIYG